MAEAIDVVEGDPDIPKRIRVQDYDKRRAN
jgi:hypothetical protein